MLGNAKAQGLPMNFIIIAVLAVLVLLAVVLFFTMGFRTESVAAQTAINTCDSRCLSEARRASEVSIDTYPNTNSLFCSVTQDVQGYDPGVRCDELTSCRVSFRDGSCTLECTEAGHSQCVS